MNKFVAGLFLVLTLIPGYATSQANFTQTPYEEQKVLFEFYLDHPEKIHAALHWVRAHFNTLAEEPYGYPPEFLKIKILIHGTEIVTMAKKNFSRYKEAVQRLQYYAELGIEIKVCRQSANIYGYNAKDLYDFVELVPSAITEIVHWQSKGYGIITPKVWEKTQSIEELR